MNHGITAVNRLQRNSGNSSSSLNSAVSAWVAQGISDGGVRPTESMLIALSNFMSALDVLGLGPSGSRMKSGNILHIGSKIFAKINIKNTATFKWVESGTVTFSEGNGCKSASSSYFDQPFTSDLFAGNALTFIQYISENNATSAIQSSHGFRLKNAVAAFCILNPLTSSQNQVNHYTTNTGLPANTNHQGLYVHTYVGTTIVQYTNGVKTSTSGTLQVADIAVNRYILARNNATTSGGSTPVSHYTRSVAVDFIYDQFNDTDAANFKTAFDAYKTAIGLP